MSYTKEPWSLEPDHNEAESCTDWNVFDRAGELVCVASAYHARRIVAAVNACRGISNFDLRMDNSAFITTFNERAEYKQRCEALQKQRDELLAEINKAREEMSCANFNSAAARLDTAIAKLKGGAA